VIDEPFWSTIEQRGRRMDVDGSAFYKRLVAFLWILLRRVSEIPRTDSFTDAVVISSSREDVVLISISH